MAAQEKLAAGDYEVGSCRPPKQTQFQKGRSGNPGGRPRAVKPGPGLVASILNEPIRVKKGGVSRRMSPFETSLRSLAKRALKDRDLKAALEFLKVCEQYGIIAPAPVPQSGGVLIIPKTWNRDDWMAMFHRYGRPPWPGQRSGLPGDPPADS